MESSIAVFLSRRSACERPPTSATARACCSTRCCCQNARARRVPALRPSPAEALGASYFDLKLLRHSDEHEAYLLAPSSSLLRCWVGGWVRGCEVLRSRLQRFSCLPPHDTVSERLRRWTRNPLGSARRGSNPLGVALDAMSLTAPYPHALALRCSASSIASLA